MTRADWDLELHLEFVREQVQAAEVVGAVQSALDHMASGRSIGHRRGGRKLVRLLEVARLRASEEDDWTTVRLLQDSIDYTTGRILQPDFEDRYRLVEEAGARSEFHRRTLAHTFDAFEHMVRVFGRSYLQENPRASGEELLEHLRSSLDDGRHIEAPWDRPGRYRIVTGAAERAIWISTVLRQRTDIDHATVYVADDPQTWKAAASLLSDPGGRALIRAAELRDQAMHLSGFRELINEPSTLESELQSALEAAPWIFGGRFVARFDDRRLVAGDEYDLPLVRGDGCLHIVELKRALGATSIVKRHRNAWVPTAEVHDAVAQAINYLVGLDEQRDRIRREHGIEARRASATVLVGHPGIHPDVPEDEINDAFRTLNAHLSRVEVRTYKDLLDSAERSSVWTTRPRNRRSVERRLSERVESEHNGAHVSRGFVDPPLPIRTPCRSAWHSLSRVRALCPPASPGCGG